MVGRDDFYLTDNIPAKYDPKKIWDQWETKELLSREHRRRVQTLERAGHYEVAEELNSCCKEKRCKSGICVKCGTRFHRWLSSNLLRIFDGVSPIYHVIYVPDPRYPPVDETVWRPEQIADRFLRRIERHCNPDTIVAGVVELGMSKTLRCLTPHVHAIVSNVTREELLAAHPGNPEWRLVYHPWVVKGAIPDDDRVRVITYLGKVLQPRRSFPINWTSRNRRLAAQARELVPVTDLEEHWLLAMHSCMYPDLLLFKGIGRDNTDELRVYPLSRRRKARYREYREEPV